MRGLPKRVVELREARRRFGPLADRVLPQLHETDPLADAASAALDGQTGAALLAQGLAHGPDAVPEAPGALRALLEDAWQVGSAPDDDAGQLLFRSGFLGGMVLGTKSLVLGYASPAGNKPLALSGQLTRPESVGKRLAETARFVMAVCEPGGMRPGAMGHQVTLRVRLMHARVRRLCLDSGRWRAEAWGHPINQHDMLATILVFSAAFWLGLEQLGLRVSLAEKQSYLHLWRGVGRVIGVVPSLLPGSVAEAERLGDLIALTQGAPDDDARALVRGYFEAPLAAARTQKERRQARLRVATGQAISRHLLDDALADALGLPPARGPALQLVRRAIEGGEAVRRVSPALHRLVVRAGHAHLARAVEFGLGGQPAAFAPPSRLQGLGAPQGA